MNHLYDELVVKEFTPVRFRQTDLYFTEKPLVVIDEALDGFLRDGMRVATAICGKAG